MPSGIDLLGTPDKESKSGLNLLALDKEVKDIKPTSGLGLLEPSVDPVAKPTLAPVTLAPRDAETFYGTHAVSPPFQGLAPMVWSPEIASYMGKQGFGPKPEGGWDELGIPLDKEGKPYYEPEKATGVIAETLQGVSSLATHPIEVVRGGLDFFLSIPGFLTGILSASSAVTKRTLDTVIMGTDTTLEDLYNISAEEMQKSAEFFDPGKRLLTGEPTPESELTAQVIMAPMAGLSMVGHKVADYEGFKDYPNVRGAARFAGDIVGLMTMGFLLHRGSKVEFTRDVERVVKEADKIIVEEQAVKGIPNEVIKQAEQKSIDARKVQLDLEAKRLAEKVAEEATVKGEAAKQAEEIIEAKTKVEPVEVKPEVKLEVGGGKPPAKDIVVANIGEDGKIYYGELGDLHYDLYNRYPDVVFKDIGFTDVSGKYLTRAEALKKADIKVPEGFEKYAEREGLEAMTYLRAKAIEEGKSPDIKYMKGFKSVEVKPELPKVEKLPDFPEAKIKPEEFKEPVTEVDRQTGVELPELKGEVSPFFQGKEKTEALRKIYDERAKSVESDPELLTQKLINDVNRWYHGDESVPIERVRETLSTVATRADELRSDFITGQDHHLWKETIIEAADWARNLDRLKIEPSEMSKADLKKAVPNEFERIEYEMAMDLDTYVSNIENRIGITKGEGKLLDIGLTTTGGSIDKGISLVIQDRFRKRKIPEIIEENFIEFGDKVRDLETGELRSIIGGENPRTYHIEMLKEKIDMSLSKLKDRLKIKPTIEPTKLYAGIPIDISVERVKKAKKVIKDLHKELTERAISSIEYLLELQNAEIANLRPDINIKFLSKDRDRGTVTYEVVSGKNKGKIFETKGAILPEDIPIRELTFGDVDVRPIIKDYDARFKKPELRIVEEAKLYAGISPQEIIKSARKVADYTQKARGMKAFKPVKAIKALREEFTRAFVDRSGNIRRKLLDDLGADGYEIVQAMYLARGSSSIAAKNLMQMRKEIYRGLSRVEKKILDDLIFTDRMIDIGKYKTEKEFKHPGGMTVEDFVRYRQAYRYKAVNGFRDLTSKEAELISQKAEGYFEWMRKVLKDMLDAELITEKEYNDLASHNYRRIKLVDVYDQKYETKIGKKVRTVYDSGVEALARGRETDIYEPSSEIMALEVFNRTYGRILNKKANQTLLDLARRDPINPFVRVKEKKGDMIPTGWNHIFTYEKGERKSLYISPEMSKEWITTNPDLSYRQSQLIRYASGSPVLRTFATGINWGFALANLPRDVMHTWYAARVFEDGKWKSIYNPNLPIFGLQIGRDLATTFSDAALRKGRYDRYIEEGGGMEFLVHQGRLFQRGRHLEGPLDALNKFMGYFGETSEIMSRLAIRERVLRRRAKEKGTTVKELDKGTKESREATFAARDYMDFGQGGWATKAADNTIPYLNASIVGTRGLWRAFRDNPASSTYKLAQFATVVSGLYIAMFKLTPETSEALKGNIDMQNNLCIPLGDDFGFEDGRGQKRYPYIKIPLDPGQKFFKTFFEASTDKWLGNPIDVNRVVDSLKEQSPVGVTEVPPSVSGVLGYATNKDFWMNEDIWRKTDKPFGWPESKEEYIPGITPEAYVDIGELTGLSPERLRYAVEELTTSGTLWSWLLGKGYNATFGGLPKSQKEQHLAEILSKTPIIKRFFGITNPYSQFAGPIEKAEEESSLSRFVQNRGLDMRSEGYLFKDNTSKKEVLDYIKSYKNVDVVDRLTDRFEFQVKTKDLPNRTFWLRLKGLSTDARAKVFVDRMDQLTPERQAQMREEMGAVIEIGGVITDSFFDEVEKLRQEK